MHDNIIDPGITDVFCMELGRVERLGPCTRLTFCVWEHNSDEPDRMVTAKLILPTEALAGIIQQLAHPKPKAPIDADRRLISHAEY
jgi:hypothetical protein